MLTNLHEGKRDNLPWHFLKYKMDKSTSNRRRVHFINTRGSIWGTWNDTSHPWNQCSKNDLSKIIFSCFVHHLLYRYWMYVQKMAFVSQQWIVYIWNTLATQGRKMTDAVFHESIALLNYEMHYIWQSMLSCFWSNTNGWCRRTCNTMTILGVIIRYVSWYTTMTFRKW